MMRFVFFLSLLFASAQVYAQQKKIIVAKDGSGHYTTVQEAINAVPDSSNTVTVIFIKKGIYKEKLRLPEAKMNVHMIGEELNNSILTFDDYAQRKDSTGKEIGTSGSSSFFIFGNNFTAEYITFENAAGPVGQAVAVRITADKARFFHCRFLGFQDTLYTHGNESRQYYFDCYIEGTVDFIFGSSTALFDSCVIYGKRGGYFTAASTPQQKNFGYVFRNCKFTGNAATGSFYLGRPWRPYAKVLIINSELSAIVNRVGWDNWGNPTNEATVFYAEYNNSGAGANTAARVSWAKTVTAEEANKLNTVTILSGWDPWK